MSDDQQIAFGPVPSRRLGRSLGINNIPPKVCSYSCVYCQLGRTIRLTVERQAFYAPDEIASAARKKVEEVRSRGEPIDAVTFVPDGEPTLDVNLGREIGLLKPLGIKIAVISNASLIDRTDVRADLLEADWVSLKVDAVQDEIWRQLNRPFGALDVAEIREGMLRFSEEFRGELVTETMLVRGMNDGDDALHRLAGFVAQLAPDEAYLAVPTRPPPEASVEPPDEAAINRAYQIMSERLGGVDVEYLIGYEGDAFASTGNAEDDLLSITAVHPMREAAVDRILKRAGADWSLVRGLIARGELVEADYRGATFYMRRLRGESDEGSHAPR